MHIYPIDDEQEHDLSGTSCKCNPVVEFWNPETGEHYSEPLIIHRSFDCREIVEQAEDILNRQ